MTWKAFHNRGETLRAVIATAAVRRDGLLPMDVPGVAETCRDASARREARALSEIWPVVPHGVKLSLGSAEGLDDDRARVGVFEQYRRREAIVEDDVGPSEEGGAAERQEEPRVLRGRVDDRRGGPPRFRRRGPRPATRGARRGRGRSGVAGEREILARRQGRADRRAHSSIRAQSVVVAGARNHRGVLAGFSRSRGVQ